MRILHGPVEVAGQLALTAYGQREIGHEAFACFPPHPLGYGLQADFKRSAKAWTRVLEGMQQAFSFAHRFDVFHFHYGKTYLPDALRYSDARWYRRLGSRVVMEVWGSDVRAPSIEAARNPFYVNSYGEDDATVRRRLERWAGITGGHVVAPDDYYREYLQPYFSDIHVSRQRVDTRKLTPVYPDPGVRVPRLVHAPSQKAFKGTRYVDEAVEALRRKGLEFEYVEVHGLTHEEARQEYARADLIVDQLCGGAHGVFAVEAMSLGKPVICYILPELIDSYPEGFPIINANPETIEPVLEKWLQSPEERYRLGVQSREYAERVHDCRVVAARLEKVYQALPRGAEAAA
jgi:hypothetical protein